MGALPVLFVHGFALDGRIWEPQQAAFSPTRRVLAPDLPGFGPHAPAPDGPALRTLARVCDEAAVDRVHLVGMSLGGAVAVDFALNSPARVASLTLVDGLLLGRRSGIAAWESAAALAKLDRLDEARAAWLADPLFDGARRNPEALRCLRACAADYRGEHWTGRSTTSFEVADPAARLGELAMPALVVVGRLDIPGFQAMADEYAAGLPNATKQIVEDAGHLPNVEVPAAFNHLLAGFLRRAEEAGA